MSHRFPPIASQHDFSHSQRRRTNGAQVIVLTLADLPQSLPWFEVLIGTVFLMALRCI